jgi:hypothetical protein
MGPPQGIHMRYLILANLAESTAVDADLTRLIS